MTFEQAESPTVKMIGEPQVTEVAETKPAPSAGLTSNPFKEGETKGDDWWRAHIPDEFKDHSSLSTINNFSDLIKTTVHSQQLIGKDKIAKLGANPTPEQRREFLNKAGFVVPESIDGYELSADGIEGVEHFGDLTNTNTLMKNLMHKYDIPKSAGEGFYKEFIATEAKELAEQQAKIDSQKESNLQLLQKEWGPSYEHNMKAAIRTISTISPDGSLLKSIQDAGLEADLATIKAYASIAPLILGDNLDTSSFERQFTMTPQKAQEELVALQSDKEFMQNYLTKDDPAAHALAVKRVTELHRIANPE